MLFITKQDATDLRDSLARLLLLKDNGKQVILKTREGAITFQASKEAIETVVAILSSEPIAAEKFVLSPKRRSLKVMEGYLKHEMFQLGSVTIPQYIERISRASTITKNNLTEYLERAKLRLERWKQLLGQVQKELNK